MGNHPNAGIKCRSSRDGLTLRKWGVLDATFHIMCLGERLFEGHYVIWELCVFMLVGLIALHVCVYYDKEHFHVYTALSPLIPPPPLPLAGYEVVAQRSQVTLPGRAAAQEGPPRRCLLCLQNQVRTLSLHRGIQVRGRERERETVSLTDDGDPVVLACFWRGQEAFRLRVPVCGCSQSACLSVCQSVVQDNTSSLSLWVHANVCLCVVPAVFPCC